MTIDEIILVTLMTGASALTIWALAVIAFVL
jgi:hypothetical protein